jgi:hypothetical protein
MHAQPVQYKQMVIMPVASLSDRGYAATAIVTSAGGRQRALGPLDYFSTEKAACEYALSYARSYLDKVKVRLSLR